VKLNPRLNASIADSLILSISNLGLSLSAILLMFSRHDSWFVVVCWVLLPPLLIVFLFFWGRDLHRGNRKQAMLALLMSIPVALQEMWFFIHLKL
jgi:hypothetical protein